MSEVRKAYIMNMYTKPGYRRKGIAFRTKVLNSNRSTKKYCFLNGLQIKSEYDKMNQLIYEKRKKEYDRDSYQ